MRVIKAFVSSCMDELHDARYHVESGLKKLKQQLGVEIQSFVFERDAKASPTSVHDIWRNQLDDSDVYIGIFYKKYGEYTAAELARAQAAGLPCFLYICTFTSNPINEIEREPKLKEFLQIINAHPHLTPDFFEYSVELEEKVQQALLEWLLQKGSQASKKLIKVQEELEASKTEIENINNKMVDIEKDARDIYHDLEIQLTISRDKEMSLEEQIIQLKSQLAEKNQQLLIVKSELSNAKTQNIVQIEEIKQLKEQFMRVEISNLEEKIDIENQIVILEYQERKAKQQFEALKEATIRLGRISSPSLNVNLYLIRKSDFLYGFRVSDAYACILRGDDLYMIGDFRKAILHYEEAIAFAISQESYTDQLEALSRLSRSWGHLANYQKEFEGATRLLGLARQFRLKDYEVAATLLLLEALAEMDLRGHWQEIKHLLKEGLNTTRFLRNNYYEVYHLLKLGKYRIQVDVPGNGFILIDKYGFQYEMMKSFVELQEALNAIHPNLGKDRYYFQGEIYGTMSLLMYKTNKKEEAIHYALLSIDAFSAYGIPLFVLRAHIALARTVWMLDEESESFSFIVSMLPQARHLGWKREEMEIEYLRGEVERRLSHTNEAKIAFRHALKLAQEMKLKEREVECMLSLGQTLIALADQEEAHIIFKQARRLSQERNYDDHFHTADTLLHTLSNEEGGE